MEIESTGIHHITLRVADLERSRTFYGDVLVVTEARRLSEPGLTT